LKFSATPHYNLQLFQNSDDDDEIESIRHENHSQSLDDLSAIINRPTPVLTRRKALDPNETHTLRTYVCHRKDTIVKRVIGYNYDDHSTAGGLYIRVGIGSK
jgi:hypothetical protein